MYESEKNINQCCQERKKNKILLFFSSVLYLNVFFLLSLASIVFILQMFADAQKWQVNQLF
jgi:hypothetical protein